MNALEPVKAASDLLGSDDSDLLACETVIKFVLEELNAQCSNISRTFYEAIKNRVLERRNIDLTSLMLYLKGEKPKVKHGLEYLPKKECRALAIKLFNRLFAVQETSEEPTQSTQHQEQPQEPSQPLSVKDRLAARLTKQKSDPPITPFVKDLNIFEKTKVMSDKLKNLNNALLTVKPTSVANERVFSSSGIFVSSQRTRLSDKSVNALIFSKYYFLNEKQDEK